MKAMNELPAKLQKATNLMTNPTIFATVPVVLEWSGDDHLRLFKMNEDNTAAIEVLFDVPIKEVENVGGNMVMLVFKIAGKKYDILFSKTAMAKNLIGGVIGVALAKADTDATGLMIWVNELRKAGIPLKGFRGWDWSFRMAMRIAILLFIVIFIFVAVQTFSGAIQPDYS